MTKNKITFEDLINMSIKSNNSNKEVECLLKIEVENETWTAYAASVTNRDILLLTDKGTCTFLIDSYGDRHVAELYDWDRE